MSKSYNHQRHLAQQAALAEEALRAKQRLQRIERALRAEERKEHSSLLHEAGAVVEEYGLLGNPDRVRRLLKVALSIESGTLSSDDDEENTDDL